MCSCPGFCVAGGILPHAAVMMTNPKMIRRFLTSTVGEKCFVATTWSCSSIPTISLTMGVYLQHREQSESWS